MAFWLVATACAIAVIAGVFIGINRLVERRGDLTIPLAVPEGVVEAFRESTPEAQGFSSRLLAAGIRSIVESGASMHSFMMMRGGAVFLDAYFPPYDGTVYHKLASVTKSVTATLVGIAIDEGYLRLDDPVLEYFPERTVSDPDGRKAGITIRHLLTMTSGLEGDARDAEPQTLRMRETSDWVQFALDRQLAREPGTAFVYSNLDMHLLSALINAATGRSAEEYGREKLFGPLGITDLFWDSDPQGNSRGWGDLCLLPRDLAKIGLLYMQGGVWHGERIVSQGWIDESTRRQVSLSGSRPEDYGYGIWVSNANEPFRYFIFSGVGGQMLRVYPEFEFIIVTTGGTFESAIAMEAVGAAFAGPGKAFREDAAGVAELRAVVAPKVAAPAPIPFATMPAIAAEISGKTYRFPDNPLNLATCSFRFDGTAQAAFEFKNHGDANARQARVGLDGRYRISLSGLPTYLKGAWIDADSFEMVFNEGPDMEIIPMSFTFSGGYIEVSVGDASAGGRIILRGESD
ncbi:MAG: hypothetical protein A2004_11470 [Spirochaetes bacterium GWC1_61_12]|nr:MAG: hypothetical protein A2Y37_01450 [Spirochaetes bacterium GWB1_60_80]OHD30691.1 MAG: hypothetical protein A2004_11470 [Spirochaetes bacterium GWC1_61_12]OHD45195.1 MAG: hypothetical protein A2Y35_10525 [Spirochaetes bacterium GWE1_60_18]OHD60169.1 MAG: hypothetical protein A2Y32_01790 [Spirochaetes bacterium GWF1_60_12]